MERRPGRRQKKRRDGSLGSDSTKEEPADVETLLGIAMGCMGISRNDFCRCTPSEFYAVYDAWNERQTRLERGRWERMRTQCLCALQPYSKSKLRAEDIMRFPWDGENEERKASSSRSREDDMSHEELMARYREAKKRAGLE